MGLIVGGEDEPTRESEAYFEPKCRSLNRTATRYPVKPERPNPGHQDTQDAGVA